MHYFRPPRFFYRTQVASVLRWSKRRCNDQQRCCNVNRFFETLNESLCYTTYWYYTSLPFVTSPSSASFSHSAPFVALLDTIDKIHCKYALYMYHTLVNSVSLRTVTNKYTRFGCYKWRSLIDVFNDVFLFNEFINWITDTDNEGLTVVDDDEEDDEQTRRRRQWWW